MKAKYAGILSAILGSICCVGPLLLIALGLGTGAAVIGRYHWFFVGAAMVVLVWAWVKHFREQAHCACEHRTMSGRGISLVTLILASAIVVGFAALNISSYVFAGSPPIVRATVAANLQRAVIPVEGMSCATCEIAVRNALKRVNGVASVHVSVATKNATIDYEPAKTNPEQLVAAINSTGYRATLPHEGSQSTSQISPPDSGSAMNVSEDQISFFKVPLVCPAAPQIGCGSAAKPVLLQLERDPAVREAWLNRAGTLIAVVKESKPEARRNLQEKLQSELRVAGCCKSEETISEVTGESRAEALREFQSGRGWYRGADVDRLSEEEAGIIVARWVRRVEAKTQLPGDKAQELQHALSRALSKCLISGDQHSGQLEDVASKYLNQEQLKVFKEAVQSGVRPLPHES